MDQNILHKERSTIIKVALYQPDIPQNVGAMMRLCACTETTLEIIHPCGFPWDERKIRQSSLDYFDQVTINRHDSWDAFFDKYHNKSRIILMTTKATVSYLDFSFNNNDILLAGRESKGVPEALHDQVNAQIKIPMKAGLRSLNIVNATAMILGEALRQTRWSG